MSRIKTRTVEHTFFIAASPRTVYRAVTDPEWMVRWLSETAQLTPRKGSAYALVFAGGWRHEGAILDCKPGKSITLSWAWPGLSVTGTKLTMSVTGKRGGTLFTMKHTGFPADARWVDLYGVTEWGWTYYAMNLKSVLESGHDLRSNDDN